MYTNSTLQPVGDNDKYIGLDGTTYPSNFPKGSIPELHEVTLTQPPEGKIALSFSIDETYTQVWQYRDKTQEELGADLERAKVSKINEINIQRDFNKEQDILHSVGGKDEYFDRNIVSNLAWLNNASADQAAIWVTKENHEVELTKSDFISICALGS